MDVGCATSAFILLCEKKFSYLAPLSGGFTGRRLPSRVGGCILIGLGQQSWRVHNKKVPFLLGPSLSTVQAMNKQRHGLIRRASLKFIISTLPLLTSSAEPLISCP